MILVTAATGHLGRLAVASLVERVGADRVIAGARRPDAAATLTHQLGVAVRELDYDRTDTIASAFDGVDQVLLISGSEIGERVAQHQRVIDAAAATGVSHVAYTSILRADANPLPLAGEHLATERAITAAGLTSTFLRNGWYQENYTENLAPALEHGALLGAASHGRIAAAARADLAAAAAAVLADPALHGATYELAGPAFTMDDLAATVSQAVGSAIAYVDLTAEGLTEALGSAGLPAPVVEFLVAADVAIADGHLDGSSHVLEDLLGRPATPLAETVKAAVDALA